MNPFRIPIALVRFLRKPFAEKRIIIEAMMLAGWFRFVIFFFPFQILKRSLGLPRPVTPAEQSVWRPDDFPLDMHQQESTNISEPVQAVAQVIRSTSRRVPWESKCLVQASSGFVMLRRRGISCRVYLGVRRESASSGQMKPHAWLTSGQSVLIGGGELHRYAVVSVFEYDGVGTVSR